MLCRDWQTANDLAQRGAGFPEGRRRRAEAPSGTAPILLDLPGNAAYIEINIRNKRGTYMPAPAHPSPPFVIAGRAKPERFALPAIQSAAATRAAPARRSAPFDDKKESAMFVCFQGLSE
jgi:hypothetical protein